MQSPYAFDQRDQHFYRRTRKIQEAAFTVFVVTIPVAAALGILLLAAQIIK